jgi:hypothetical protein
MTLKASIHAGFRGFSGATTEPVVHLSGPIHTQLGCLIDRKAEMEIAR